MIAKQCFLTACANKVKVGKVQIMELHKDTSTLDDVGQTPEKNAIEDFKKIQIDRHNRKKKILCNWYNPVQN